MEKTCEHAGGEDDVEQGDVGGGRAHYHRRKQGTWVLICFPHFPKVVRAPIKLSQPKNWCQESVVLTNHAKESLLTNHANQSSPIMAPKAAAPAMAAVVNIRSRSENHTWLTCESK